jgi:hypothetical protein
MTTASKHDTDKLEHRAAKPPRKSDHHNDHHFMFERRD